MQLGALISGMLNKANLFPPPMTIEFEKMLCPFMSSAKKHYAGRMHAPNSDKTHITIKGLASVRRDAIGIMKRTYETILNMALEKNASKIDIRNFVRAQVMLFYTKQVRIEDITIT